MIQEQFLSYLIKGSSRQHIDYVKALGGARFNEIAEIARKEEKNHACARIGKK